MSTTTLFHCDFSDDWGHVYQGSVYLEKGARVYAASLGMVRGEVVGQACWESFGDDTSAASLRALRSRMKRAAKHRGWTLVRERFASEAESCGDFRTSGEASRPKMSHWTFHP